MPSWSQLLAGGERIIYTLKYRSNLGCTLSPCLSTGWLRSSETGTLLLWSASGTSPAPWIWCPIIVHSIWLLRTALCVLLCSESKNKSTHKRCLRRLLAVVSSWRPNLRSGSSKTRILLEAPGWGRRPPREIGELTIYSMLNSGMSWSNPYLPLFQLRSWMIWININCLWIRRSMPRRWGMLNSPKYQWALWTPAPEWRTSSGSWTENAVSGSPM